ncbi:putative amidotransferase [Saccharomycopsis crataegensis]|uniref:Amidotransferase n=1 Tax=Saccharomycopsis crataegensis TaxID=43959 RepID=A0AAV5QKL0_9ASCO|nr:putative amidotransferase [Saccharomycopsis crataegensis]
MSQFIAILFTDTPQVPYGSSIAKKYGDYGDQSIKLLEDNIPSNLPHPNYSFKKYRTKEYMQLPSDDELKSCCGVLVTGSRSDSFDNHEEWLIQLEKFLGKLLLDEQSPYYKKIPVVGICFGHQLLAKLFDNNGHSDGHQIVGRNHQGWELGLKEIAISEKFTKYAESLLQEQSTDQETSFSTGNFRKLWLVESHQDVVYSVPSSNLDLLSIGSTNICEVQGLFDGKSVLTFQGHPEFDTDFQDYVLLHRDVDIGILTMDEYREMIGKSGRINDGWKIGQLINAFYQRFGDYA